ncbi:MAG: DUF2063 domain-containing protein [Gammaproteobacteria bacterium]|nr:MAG: DUF2063 domain-containing protein [Gammaproteobacteria bacterium]
MPMSTSPDSLPDFQRRQLAFAEHIRDPARPAPEEIPDERMAVYRELFFNGFDDQLSSIFPVLRAITDDSRWEEMVRDFMRRHRCRTPLFTRIGEEFLDYLQNRRKAAPDDFPFLLELAHYEYAELAVAVSDADQEMATYDPNGDLLEGHPVLAPTAWILGYRFPVHRIGPDFLPTEAPPQPTHLVIYRDRQHEVHFLEINAVTAHLLQLLKEDPVPTGLECLRRIAQALQHPQPDTLIDFGAELLQEMRQRNIVLGAR